MDGEVQRRAGRRLRDRREERGWVREELARRAGVSVSLLAQFERGEANPSLATLVKLAEAAGLTLAELVSGAGEEGIPVALVDPVVMWHGDGASHASLVVAASGRNETELWRYELDPDDRYVGEAHPRGSEVLIHVLEGSIDVRVGSQTATATSGMSMRLASDARHEYANTTAKPAIFALVYTRTA